MDGQVTAVISQVLTVDPAELDDERLHAAVLELTRAASLLAAARARLVAAWDARKVWAADGSKVGSALLARETGCAVTTAKTETRRARRLASMPATRAAFEAGRLSVDAVDLLCSLNHGRYAEAFARDEATLVTVAESVHHDELVRFTGHWRNLADATCEDRARKRARDRYLKTAITLDGDTHLEGWLPAVDGAIVRGEVARLERELFDADWAEARERRGASATPADLRRDTDQRRADALVEMAKRSAAKAPGVKEGRILVSILVGYETLRDRVCETADGIVLTPGQITDRLKEADLERIVFDTPSRVIDVSHQRCFTGALRRAIEIRDRHCSHPGCRVPATQCQVDHIVEHSAGGETSLDNGRLLCPAHNRRRPGRTDPEGPQAP